MKLLVIDTCGAMASVVLAEHGQRVAEERLPGRSASERLLTVIRELLEGAQWQLSELAALGVVHGPGSFTGVRVGVSAAKGLSEAAGVRLVAISRLEVLEQASGGAAVALDAGRGEFYVRENGVEALRGLPDGAMLFEEGKDMRGAVEAIELVAERVRSGQIDDTGALDANYVRWSEGLYGRVVR